MKTEIDSTKVLCRICGEEFNSSICLSVFSEAGIQQELQYKISHMLRIQISPQGNMPKQICHMCLNRLDAAYDLFKMCESVQDNIQRKVAGQALINGVHLLEDHHLTLLEEKCKSLTEHSPIMIGGSVLKLRHAPIQTEQPAPVNQVSQPVLAYQLTTLPQNQTVVPNQNSWHPQQQSEQMSVQLSCTDMVPQPAQVTPVQYNHIQQQPNTNQVQNGSSNNSSVSYYQHPPTAQRTTPITSPAQTVNEVQRIPRPMIGPKSKRVPRPIPCPPASRPSPLCRKPQVSNNLQEVAGPLSKKPMRQCQYCKRNFSEDIIDHHVNLHLRKAFFTCIDCNKNFRTESGLEKHRCGKSDGEDEY